MIAQLFNLLAQDSTIEAIVKEQTQGNSVPPSAIERTSDAFWFPEQASNFAPAVDSLYMFIFWVSAFFFAGIVGAMTYFVIKYRRKGKEIVVEPSPSHNTMIEILWSVLPSFLLLYMFWAGAEGYFESRVPREDAEEIQVRAFRWNWEFTYPDGDVSSELHLVYNRPTKLVMRSDDVLHSLYIPAFRQKMDVVPGRYTYAYFQPTEAGKFRLACTEYCGDEHSRMRTMCEVHMSDEERKAATEWIEPEHPDWENGARLYRINCAGCHKVDGQAATGPALNLVFENKVRQFYGGGSRPVDENYIRESILYPDREVVEGYGPVSKMNSFEGKLTPRQIDYLIAYLKTFRDGIPDPALAPATGEDAEAPEGAAEGAGESTEAAEGSAGEEAKEGPAEGAGDPAAGGQDNG